MSATTLPVGCNWPAEIPDTRTITHLMTCERCADTWPQIARQMRQATGKALPTDDPKYIGANVGYKDK